MRTEPLAQTLRASLIALLIAAGAPAAAQGSADDRARALYEEGAGFYEEGRYDEAIERWWDSWELSGRPELLYNLAGAYERLGSWEETLDVLERYREVAPSDEWPIIDRRIENISRRLDDQREREQPADPEPQITQTPVVETQPLEAEIAGEPREIDALPLALYGVSAAGLATGVAFGLRARGARSQAEALCLAEGGLCPESANDALQRDRTSSLIADVGFAVGLAGAAGGVALSFSGRGASDPGVWLGFTRGF